MTSIEHQTTKKPVDVDRIHTSLVVRHHFGESKSGLNTDGQFRIFKALGNRREVTPEILHVYLISGAVVS